MVLLIAHVGHWALWILYAVPIVIVLGSIVFTLARERRERRGDARPATPDPNP